MKDRLQLNSHPINARARKILKAAKIPWSKETMMMPATALMLWTLQDEEREAQLPMMEMLEEFQERYATLEEAVLDLDRRAPEVLLSLIEDHEGDVAIAAEHLMGLSPEEAGARLVEELNSGMALHPERYQ